MSGGSALEQGRSAWESHDWSRAYALLIDAGPLTGEDLERLAAAAYLIGLDDESETLWARAHQDFLERGDCNRAARAAFWLAFEVQERGERARASGWLSRAATLIAERAPDCAAQGYLLLPSALERIAEGDAEAAYELFCTAAAIARRHGDPDLEALACHSRGRALIRMGDIAGGIRLLDEAMAAVDARAVSPLVTGDVYCSVIEGCMEVYDLRRAQEWTAVLTDWCDAQPDLVPFRGQCLVRRAEILQYRGEWDDAVAAAEQACRRLTQGVDRPAAGLAFYRLAELHRLRGEYERAEGAYREASRRGHNVQPGLSLLRLARGQIDAARTALRNALDAAADKGRRARLLPAQVEVALAAGDVEGAAAAAAELEQLADHHAAPLLRAQAAHARGAVLLARDAAAALPHLQSAWAEWHEIGVPYDSARVRVLTAMACTATGDEDAADIHLDAARWTLQHIGAAPDLARIDALLSASAARTGDLTRRELEVLRHIARGETNRGIAAALFISERTVERHVSSILSKLGLRTRAAATAYAWEHGLAAPRIDS